MTSLWVGAGVGAGVGQGNVLHTASWLVGQLSPPWAACRVTSTMRMRVPVPQLRLQSVHGRNSCRQSTGQGCVPQFCRSVSGGHALPPYLMGAMTLRARLCTPPPQRCVHPDHAPQVLATQGCWGGVGAGVGSGRGVGAGVGEGDPKDSSSVTSVLVTASETLLSGPTMRRALVRRPLLRYPRPNGPAKSCARYSRW